MTKICNSCNKEIKDDACSIFIRDLWFCCECMNISKYTVDGIESINKGDFEEGIKIFKKAIKTKPTDAEAWFRRGKAHMALGEFYKAFVCFTEASKYGDSPSIDLSLRTARLRSMGLPDLGSFLPAEAQLGDLVYFANIKDPNDVSNEYNENGVIFQMTGDFKSALDCYEKALKKNPQNKSALRNKKRLLRIIKKLETNKMREFSIF